MDLGVYVGLAMASGLLVFARTLTVACGGLMSTRGMFQDALHSVMGAPMWCAPIELPLIVPI